MQNKPKITMATIKGGGIFKARLRQHITDFTPSGSLREVSLLRGTELLVTFQAGHTQGTAMAEVGDSEIDKLCFDVKRSELDLVYRVNRTIKPRRNLVLTK